MNTRERADDRLAEHRDIVWLPGSDEVAVLGDRLVHVETTRVLDVDSDRRPAGEGSAAERIRGNQKLGTMTNRGDGFAGFHRFARKVDHGVTQAHLVGRIAPGDDQRVEVSYPGRARGQL